MPMTRRNSTRKSGFVVLWGKSEADSDYDKKADLERGVGFENFATYRAHRSTKDLVYLVRSNINLLVSGDRVDRLLASSANHHQFSLLHFFILKVFTTLRRCLEVK